MQNDTKVKEERKRILFTGSVAEPAMDRLASEQV